MADLFLSIASICNSVCVLILIYHFFIKRDDDR